MYSAIVRPIIVTPVWTVRANSTRQATYEALASRAHNNRNSKTLQLIPKITTVLSPLHPRHRYGKCNRSEDRLRQALVHVLQLGLEVAAQLGPLRLHRGCQQAVLDAEGVRVQVDVLHLEELKEVKIQDEVAEEMLIGDVGWWSRLEGLWNGCVW